MLITHLQVRENKLEEKVVSSVPSFSLMKLLYGRVDVEFAWDRSALKYNIFPWMSSLFCHFLYFYKLFLNIQESDFCDYFE